MLKTVKDIHYVQTDFSNIVSTLHDKLGRNLQRTDELARRKVVGCGQLEETDRIVLKGIDPQRHHQMLRRKFPDMA